MSRTRRTALLALLLAPALVAAACGDDGSASARESQGTEGVDSGGEGEPKRGGTLTMAYASDIDSLDPHEQSSFNTHQRIGLVYSRLLAFEIGPDVPYTAQNLVGDLAEDWEVSDDGRTYTFHLRDDVAWQDVAPLDGRPFTSDDVLATFERIRTEGFQRYMLENVESFETPDEHTFVINMSAPFAPLLNFMANHYMWIIPREAAEGQIDLESTAVGTGPFIMERRERNVETVYRRNPDYFEEGKPHLDGIRVVVMPDQGAQIAAFRTGDLDVYLTSLSPEEVAAMKRTNPDARYDPRPGNGLLQLYVNSSRAPFDDVRVRTAVSMAVDRMGMGTQMYGDALYTGPVPTALSDWSLSQEELAELLPYDPEGARELLAEAGYPDGFDTTLMLTNGYGAQVVRQGEWIVEDLAAVGIRADIEVVEYATYFGQRWPKVEYEIAYGPQTPFLEPDEWLRAVMRTGATRNWYHLSDPELDEMLDHQTTILDREERRDYVKDIQRYFLEEVLNPIPMINPVYTHPEQPWVENYHPHASYGWYAMKDVWLDR